MPKGGGKPKMMKNTKGFSNNFNKTNKQSIPKNKAPNKKLNKQYIPEVKST